jgi:hypothetical protein
MVDSTTSCNFPEEKIEKEKEEYFLQIHKEADIVYIPFNINERMTFEFDKNNSIIN